MFFAVHIVSAQNDILVNAKWLEKNINDDNLVIFYVGSQRAYNKGHIPGAIRLPSSRFTYDGNGKMYDLPTVEKLKQVFESRGVSNNSKIVLYTSYIPSMTRLFFTLDYLGLGKNTHILDGGLVSWKANGGKLSTEAPTIKKGTLKIKGNDKVLAKKNDLLKIISNKSKNIVDCRATSFYKGIQVNRMQGGRKGHLPGAKTIPFTSLWKRSSNGATVFKSKNELAKIFESQGLSKNKGIVLYCHIGFQLTVVYTAAKILGYKDVRVYDGSMHEWGPDKSLPLEY